MSDWVRATRECALDALPADMAGAVREHIERHNLGLEGLQASICIETTSRKKKPGLFDHGKDEVVTGVLLFPRSLVWAIRAESPPVTVVSARLADITVQDYAATPFARMVPDAGVEVSGAFTEAAERGSSFIGLGESPAAQSFQQALLQAVQATL